METAREYKDTYLQNYNAHYDSLYANKQAKKESKPKVDESVQRWRDSNDSYEDNFLSNNDDDFYQRVEQSRGYSEQELTSDNLTDSIASLESGGNYKAFNGSGGGSGAVGKYQFRWDLHKDKIKEYAQKDVKINEFLNSPELQDGFFKDYWMPKVLMPEVNMLSNKLRVPIDKTKLGRLIHFRGLKGAMNYLSGNLTDKPEEFNMSISKYTGIKPGKYMQQGGVPYSSTTSKKYNPVNIDYYQRNENIPYSTYEDSVQLDKQNTNLPFNLGLFGEEDSSNVLQEIDKKITNTLESFKKINNIRKDLQNIPAQAVSLGTDALSVLSSQKASKDMYYNKLEDLYEENQNNYLPLLDYQNKQKTTYT